MNVKSDLIDCPRSLTRNSPDCIIMDDSAFDNFTITDKSFAKTMQRLITCLSTSGKL